MLANDREQVGYLFRIGWVGQPQTDGRYHLAETFLKEVFLEEGGKGMLVLGLGQHCEYFEVGVGKAGVASRLLVSVDRYEGKTVKGRVVRFVVPFEYV